MSDNNHYKLFGAPGRWFGSMGRVFRNEFSLTVKDVGVLLFFVALPLVYPIAYTLIYNPEIVTEIHIAVVDRDRSADSRHLTQLMDASPAIDVRYSCANLEEAKRLYAGGDIYGILEIPSDYSKNIARGEQAHVPFYAEMSLLLRYRAFISALSEIQLQLAGEITQAKLDATGVSALGLSGLPVESHSNFLGDPGQGFASFVMPGIVILILQQSMVLGICMLGGTSRDRRRRSPDRLDPFQVNDASVTATIIGKALCYVVLYLPMCLYVVKCIPEIFALPHQGDAFDYLLFMVPFLFASAMFGLTVQGFCTERESGFITFVFTSVVFLFLSGLTWPRYAMNGFYIWLGNMIPGTWGVEGFIRINSNGATLADNAGPFIWMWALTGFYFLTSCWVIMRQRRYLTRV